MIFYIGAIGLIIIGLYIVLTKRNLIKVIIGLDLFETGIFILLVCTGYVKGGTAPIFSKAKLNPSLMVDPIPQALVLTAIVIGVATLALALSLAIRLYRHYGTLDVRKIKELKW
jgi:multicomponent Na+:H+ antiporter subunit C